MRKNNSILLCAVIYWVEPSVNQQLKGGRRDTGVMNGLLYFAEIYTLIWICLYFSWGSTVHGTQTLLYLSDDHSDIIL